jgi:putative chitinase
MWREAFMCIDASVGAGCPNQSADVKIVQILLNMNGANPALVADGLYGKNTGTAIGSFQSAKGEAHPSGQVDARGATLVQLKQGIPDKWDGSALQAIMTNATSQRITLFLAPLQNNMATAGITLPLQKAHFLAQIAHESGELRYTEELASGEDYEDRRDLGNTQPGDGPRFKGRGLIQLTGRTNYTNFMKDSGVDVVSNPQQVATNPDLAVRVSCWFWQKHNLNNLAVGDDVGPVTYVVNGGYTGRPERQRFFNRAKFFLVS